MTDYQTLRDIIAAWKPDEIYNLSGQSSVARSYQFPLETFESIVTVSEYILEAVRNLSLPVKIFSAGSGDCFGDLNGRTADITTPFSPQSPYAEAKVQAFQLIETFRKDHGLFACTGVLYNHESCLRPDRFVTRKIVKEALDIARGESHELVLGDITIRRDWGWAPEYVDAMWRMLQGQTPVDYIIATGTTIRLMDFVETVFTRLDLDWKKYVRTDPGLYRSKEIPAMYADPGPIYKDLGWKARYKGLDVAKLMVAAEQACDRM
jgi:GDPmannose 4,6-dehydratase